jgi:hypothetical protein
LLSAVSTAQGAHQQQLPQPPLIKLNRGLDRTIVSLNKNCRICTVEPARERAACETSTKQAIMYGKWLWKQWRSTAASDCTVLLSTGGEKKVYPDTQYPCP